VANDIYRILVDPKENRIRTTVSADTWVTGTASTTAPPFTYTPDRYGDGGTWRFSATQRNWFTMVSEQPGAKYDFALLDRNNKPISTKSGHLSFISVEVPATDEYTMLHHTWSTDPATFQLTPWKAGNVVIDGAGYTVEANDRRGRGGMITFEGEISREVDVIVEYAGKGPKLTLERPSGVFLSPRAKNNSTGVLNYHFELPESGAYRVLVDVGSEMMDFTVRVVTH
jgi:hypothetical protein